MNQEVTTIQKKPFAAGGCDLVLVFAKRIAWLLNKKANKTIKIKY
jgi:hypothetical protein